MEKKIRLVFVISLVTLLIEGFLCLGYAICTGLNKVTSDGKKQLPGFLTVALAISAIVFSLCILFMCVFQVIHIYKSHGSIGLIVVGVITAVVFVGSYSFNKVLLEEENCIRNSIILTLGVMMLGLMISSYKRVKKEK